MRSARQFAFVLFAGIFSAAHAGSLQWWVDNPLVKVKPQDPVPRSPPQTANLYAARNEFEPFQLILRSEGKNLDGLDVEVSDLAAADGARIASGNVTVYVEQYMNLTKASSVDGGTGLWPDALVPRVDRYANERRNAFPLNLPQDRNQPLWVEIFVPENAQPGDYAGTLRATRHGATDFTVPIHLHVWDFELPSTSSLKSSFGFNGTTALKQHRGEYTSDSDLYSLTRLYAKAALQHRITIHGGSMVPPRFTYSGHRMDIDWHAYDAEVGPFLAGTAIPAGQPLHGAMSTTVELRSPSAFENNQQRADYWAGWLKHFQEKSWDSRLFLYLWDEPTLAEMPKVIEKGTAALGAVPSLRTLLTVSYDAHLQDVVKIWVPLINCLTPRPGFKSYCDAPPPFSAYAPELKQGKSLWFYQSCASHGCNGPGGPYFTGWPSYMIDAPGASNRVMQWVAWTYRIEGELYYSMDEAYAYGKDPWTNFHISGGNGDGTLFYPGRPSRIGGSTDIPIESIRLKLIREGMEDYEYLALLAKMGGEKLADEFAGRIVKAPYLSETRADAFMQVRLEMGQALDHLSRQRAGMGSNAR
jgi:Domain of unknown function (DUF4091)